jgi:acetyl esterase/lipase
VNRGAAVLAAAAVAATVSCSAHRAVGGDPAARPAPPPPATTDYLPGVAADVHAPAGRAPRAVIVLVPGGAWRTADREGLAPLAEHLAVAGHLVVNATYRAAADGVQFPVEVEDVTCAIAFAAAGAGTGLDPSHPVIVVGHSSGAHLAALAALAGSAFTGACPWPEAAVDALIGLAGVYDVHQVPEIAEQLFGVPLARAPDRWRDGNPFTWVDRRPALGVFLAHGDADDLVPVPSSQRFAAALERAGHPVRVEIVRGADHHAIYSAELIAPRILAWIDQLGDAERS